MKLLPLFSPLASSIDISQDLRNLKGATQRVPSGLTLLLSFRLSLVSKARCVLARQTPHHCREPCAQRPETTEIVASKNVRRDIVPSPLSLPCVEVVCSLRG